jgi:CubicO group peptidase (beta-lactamase class C family)
MRRFVGLVSALLLWPKILVAAQPDQWLEQLPERIEKERVRWEIPGLAVAITRKDQVLFERGFGLRELAKSEAVDENTLFAIASNSKAFTAAAVGLALSEKHLNYDTKVAAILPSFRLRDPYATAEIQVKDLLCHRAGFDTWAGDLLWYGSNLTRPQVVAGLAQLEPSFGFRERYGYCNLMFIVAGELIPPLTGSSWENFVKSRLIDPLGMTRTAPTLPEMKALGNYAIPHNKIHDQIRPLPYRDLGNCAPAGGLNSSVHDLTRWLRMQLGGGRLEGKEIVPSKLIAQTRRPQMILPSSELKWDKAPKSHFRAYGLGWFLRDYEGHFVVWHTGGMDGMISLTAFLPDDDIAVAVLTNYEKNELNDAIFFEIIDHYLGFAFRDWSTFLLQKQQTEEVEEKAKRHQPMAAATLVLPLEKFTGAFTNETVGSAEITLEGGSPRVKLSRYAGMKSELKPAGPLSFTCEWEDPEYDVSSVIFAVDLAGVPTKFTFKVRDWIDPREYIFTRAKKVEGK